MKVTFAPTVALALALLIPLPTRAGILGLHTQAHLTGQGSGGSSGLYYDVTQNGSSGITNLFREGSGSGNGIQSARSFVHSEANANNLLGFSATSSSNRDGPSVPRGAALASVSWRDIIFLTAPGPGPASLQLQLQVEGSLEVSDLALAEVGVYFGNLGLTTATISTPPTLTLPIYAQLSAVQGFRSRGFTLLELTGTRMVATFTYNAPYEPTLGGYFFNLVSLARTFAARGVGAANFDSTIHLTGILGANGRPLGPGDVRFDSGLLFGPQAAPVPEPSTLLLLAGAAAVGLRRRWTKRPA